MPRVHQLFIWMTVNVRFHWGITDNKWEGVSRNWTNVESNMKKVRALSSLRNKCIIPEGSIVQHTQAYYVTSLSKKIVMHNEMQHITHFGCNLQNRASPLELWHFNQRLNIWYPTRKDWYQVVVTSVFTCKYK